MPAGRGSGLRVSATSLVLAGADRHSGRCGVSSTSPHWPSATGPATTHPNLASAAPLRQCALLGLHLFQRGKDKLPRGRRDLHLYPEVPSHPTHWAAALTARSFSQSYNQGSPEGDQPLWTLRCQRRTAWRRREELTTSRGCPGS